MSQLGEHGEAMLTVFVDAFARWEGPLIEGLRRMQSRAELRAEVRAEVSVGDLADLTMAAMQGGLPLAQVRRDGNQLRLALSGARAALTAARARHEDQPWPASA